LLDEGSFVNCCAVVSAMAQYLTLQVSSKATSATPAA
jgi:hypothetical protein